jgi:hypothetical protein
MQAFWTDYGFYLWALTTALVLVALIWLGWNTFASGSPDDDEGDDLGALSAQVTELVEGTPLMKASLGRALQFVGVERYTNAEGEPASALAVVNARGDGFLLVSGAGGGSSARPIAGWAAEAATPPELSAIQQARNQVDGRR